MHVQELLTKVDVTFKADDKLSAALETMSGSHHSCALICDEGRLTGIITERDLVRLYAGELSAGRLRDPQLKEVMTLSPITVTPQTDLGAAISLARSHKLRHLPVVNENRELAGILTLTNMLSAWMSLTEENGKLETMNKELKLQSMEDSLTGLFNRRAMEVDLKHSEIISKRKRESYAIAMMDVDYFKLYNDHYGHDAGDAALRLVARVLKNNIRGSDKAYRYGGEEFLYLMPDTDINGALNVCERIRFALFHSRIEHIHSPHHFLSLSMGIAAASGGNWEELLRQADTALYQAKKIGRNTICTAIVSGPHTLAISDKRLSDSQVH